MKKLFTPAVCLVALATTLSLSAVPWNDAPPAVKKTVRAHMGTEVASDYDKQSYNGETVYHFAFQHAGQNVDMNVAENGALLKNDIRTNGKGLTPEEWNALPARVTQAAEAQKGGATIERFQKIRENGVFVYHFNFRRGGRMSEIALNEDGSAFAGAVAAAQPQTAVAGSAMVPFKDLPWTVQKPMLDQSSYAKIEQVERTVANGRTVYVANYQKDGRNHQIRVADDGTILSGGAVVREGAGATYNRNVTPLGGAVKVQMESLPPNIQRIIRNHANGAAIEDIDRGTLNGKVVYEAAFKRNDRTIEVRVAEDGTVLGEHRD